MSFSIYFLLLKFVHSIAKCSGFEIAGDLCPCINPPSKHMTLWLENIAHLTNSIISLQHVPNRKREKKKEKKIGTIITHPWT